MSKKSIGPSTLSLGLGDIPQSYQSKEQEARVAELLQQFYKLFEEILAEISSPLDAKDSAGSPAEEEKKKEDNERFINAILSEEAKHHLRLISCVVNAELRVQLLQTFVGSLFIVSELRRFTRPARSAAKTLHNKKSSNGGKKSGAKKIAKAALWRDPSLEYAKKKRAATNGRFCQLIVKFWKKNGIKGVKDRQLARVVAKWIEKGEITLSTPDSDA
jgi:hypothetical protein